MKRLKLFGIAILFVVLGYLTYENKKMSEIQEGIAQKIIRFHVRANSDRKEDQELKLLVRDAVCEYLEEKLKNSESLDETRDILSKNSERIKEIAQDVIASEGKSYSVNVYFEEAYFPLKTYGDMTFPPGEYEAFRIDIGEAVGNNWWCVMYPPLCFVDSTYAIVPDETKEDFKEILTTKEYDAITIRNAKQEDIEFAFKWFE